MRFMDIRPFERAIEIGDFDFLVRSRINQAMVVWPEQAFPLAGYMGWPNDPEARAASVQMLREWSAGSKTVPPRLRKIQADWTRVADIFNLHYDLAEGRHQSRRGGASIGKAIELTAAQSKGTGTGKANLWEAWRRTRMLRILSPRQPLSPLMPAREQRPSRLPTRALPPASFSRCR